MKNSHAGGGDAYDAAVPCDTYTQQPAIFGDYLSCLEHCGQVRAHINGPPNYNATPSAL